MIRIGIEKDNFFFIAAAAVILYLFQKYMPNAASKISLAYVLIAFILISELYDIYKALKYKKYFSALFIIITDLAIIASLIGIELIQHLQLTSSNMDTKIHYSSLNMIFTTLPLILMSIKPVLKKTDIQK